MKGDYAIIPVREFGATKLRLEKKLSREERSSLTSALLFRVVSALQLSKMERIVVVASDASEVSKCLGAIPKLEVIGEKIPHGGVNKAMQMGISYARVKKAVTVTLLPSDLPFINHVKLDLVLNKLRNFQLVINGSAKKDGTNLLAMKIPVEIGLHYDDNSYVKHIDEATKKRLAYESIDWFEFSMDVDDTIDLERAMRLYKCDGLGEFLVAIQKMGI